MPYPLTGLDQVAACAPWRRRDRVGLLANQASLTHDGRYAWDVLAEQGCLAALFSPQHGLWAEEQANMRESSHFAHPTLGVPVFSLYSETREPLPAMLEPLDRLVIDLQDVGTRVYTFAWTMFACLEACGREGLPVTILDRPNPIGGEAVEGLRLVEGFESFVGRSSIPMRHGLTIGELARYLVARHRIDVELDIVRLQDWHPASFMWQWQRLDQWMPPSPNLPSAFSCLVYAGNVLFEGTNVSEGRGTTRPFEVVGAPFVSARALAAHVARYALPGVDFLPIRFRPTFDKWADETCSGLWVRVTDPPAFRPFATAVALLASLRTLYPDSFRWIDPPYEYENRLRPIDIIAGSDRLRQAIDAGRIASRLELEEAVRFDEAAWWEDVDSSLLYGRSDRKGVEGE